MDWEAYLRRHLEDAERVATYTNVTDPAVLAVLDVLAPRIDGGEDRLPIFEFGHETTPTRIEMVELATEVAAAVRRALRV